MVDARQLATFTITVVIVGLVLSSFFGAVSSEERRPEQTAVALAGDTGELEGRNITNVGVEQSLGDAAALDGSQDSYLSGTPDPPASGNWSVATWVRVNNSTGTRLIYADPARVLAYRGSTNEWVASYYNQSSGDTYRTAELANNPGSWTHLTVDRAGDTVTIYENNTDNSSVTLTAGNTVSSNLTTQNLNGTLDETRAYNESLTSSERQQLINRPTAPLPAPERTLRIYYDSYASSPSTLPAFFAGTQVDVSNVRLVPGFVGEPTVAGTDYSRSGDTITALAGGSLDGAPAFYADYLATFGGFPAMLEPIANVISSGVGLLALGVLVGAASLLMQFYGEF